MVATDYISWAGEARPIGFVSNCREIVLYSRLLLVIVVRRDIQNKTKQTKKKKRFEKIDKQEMKNRQFLAKQTDH